MNEHIYYATGEMDLVLEYYQIIDKEHVAKRAFILLADTHFIMMAS